MSRAAVINSDSNCLRPVSGQPVSPITAFHPPILLPAMPVSRPFNFQQWIDEHRHLLKPPVGNQQVFKGNDDFIVMVVGGPNARKDYHVDDSEEFFFQVEGDMVLKIIEDGQPVDVPIRAGEIFLLPAGVPHSPQRPAGTVGMVVERYRKPGELDGFQWYCENCGTKLYEEFAEVTDIVQQLPVIMGNFWQNEARRTCQSCGTVMQPPAPVS
ncbi:3-hydroxyanthranilate 3,4-dioxygenase [Hymenobacter koreensis]|uniref:3-hydroxyanthranilate 3,4-dioxygenase n=2 Tax=Hymenobacter koreensis TaxID=1084523 RepID=A0ABP8IXV0_9BACT